MIEPGRLPALVAGALALTALLVLPGFGIGARLARPATRGTAPLVLAVAASVLVVTAIAVPLLAGGWFSGLAVVLAVALPAAWGMPAFAGWLRRTLGPRGRVRAGGRTRAGGLPTAGWLALLSVPWIVVGLLPGYPPADRLQWYYARVAGQLGEAGGIPAAVAEWGRHVRWLPDYLVFDVLSEAHGALLPGVSVAEALSAWRLPVAVAGLAITWAVLRLWVGRAPAALGTALIGGTTFFVAKFNAYKPESLGIVLGLLAVWLVVRAIRSNRRSWLLVAGVLLGADLAVHAIAAVATGLLAAGLGAAEWLVTRRGRLAVADGLVRAVVLGLALSVALGVGLQGRATVAGQALAPQRAAGEDPTWTFFLYGTGVFDDPLPEPPARPIAGGVLHPWDGFLVASAFGWWLLAAVGIGLLLLLGRGGRRGRAGVVGLGLAGGLLGIAVAFFAVAFDTYVPRWTGLVRFGQYAPLGVGLAVALALEGYLRFWTLLAGRPIPRALTLVAAAGGVAWLVAWAVPRYADEPRIAPAGLDALARLGELAPPDAVVVSNVLTAGTIESFTGRENPLEGRQPLIEEPDLLAGANDLLRDAHAFFAAPRDRSFVDGLAASWLLVADDPATLGATATVGGSVDAVADLDWLRPAWRGEGVALFEVVEPAAGGIRDDPRPLPRVGSTALAALGFVVLAVILARWRGVAPPIRRRAPVGAAGRARAGPPAA